MDNRVAIIIPVYKENMTDSEEQSFRQTLCVLENYAVVIVCPKSLDILEYNTIAGQFDKTIYRESFADTYFKDIAGYNRLLLSDVFYRRFKRYEFVLIVQLDAYVFEDQLDWWCQKGYDYIGAPLVGQHTDNLFSSSLPLRVGNGGFSLRRVQAYLDYFNGKKNVFAPKQLINKIGVWQKPYTRIFIWLLMLLGWRNTPKSVAAHWQYNEDDFWSGILDNSNYALSKPSPIEALSFAFERFPKELYEITKQIPFGCHAWKKYQYDEFWKQYIELSNKS